MSEELWEEEQDQETLREHAKIDKTMEKVNAGQTARVVRSYTEGFLLDKEEDLLQKAISQYHAGQLTEKMAMCMVAEIAGLRAFRVHLEQKIRTGVLAAEKELGDA